MNIDFVKLCGKHTPIYEAYYKQMDPKGTGTIEAMAAAKFLKKSGLSDVVLSRVWDLSDPNGKGYLDKPGFFVALKLVSLAQAGHVYNMNNIYMDTEKPPKVGDLPKIMPPRVPPSPVVTAGAVPAAAPTGDWSIRVIDRLKYEQLFESLKPVGGMLPGNKVKGVLLDSKLPMDTLGKIWDLADQDKDGNLDKHEFIVAMHLVYKTLEKRTVPDVLPPELRKPGVPPPKPAPPVIAGGATMPRAPSNDGFGDGGFVANFPKDIAPPPAIPIPPAIQRVPPVGGPATVGPLISTDPLIPIGAPPSVTANADWVVGAEEFKRFEVMFREADRDKDGLVSGLEVKNVFLQSGVPQKMLAHIWALCDTNQSGKLTLEQFALAMWMVERKQKGIDPPQVLTANMVPPSMRGIVSGVDIQPQEPKPTYTNPELEMISKEIEELAKERRALETEIAQKEADIRIKNGEVRSLQSELDTLSATLKQLENQRGEAQKRLDDLKAQVNKIREQCQKQEETINEQEGELNAKRSELQKLKDEENSLQKEYDENNRELQKLTNHLQNTQLQISSIRSMVTQLMETQRQMTDALLMCRAAIDAENAELVSEYQLKIEPDFSDARIQLEKEIEIPKDDPFNDTTTAAMNNKNNGFASNGFDSDPFTGSTTTAAPAKGGFDDSFNTGFDANFDAFASSNTSGFGGDAFGGSAFANKPAEPAKDNFDNDPFAALHAPTGQGQVLSPNTQTQQQNLTTAKSGPPPRPESPSPALPPKKSKVPPPRPAPPRPLQAPNRPAQPEGFGSTAGSGGFADFADFDTKAPIIPPPLPTIPYKSATNPLKTKPSNTNSSSSSSVSTSNLSLFENFTLTPATSNITTSSSTATTNSNNISSSSSITLGSNNSSSTTKQLDDSFSDLFKNVNTTTTSTTNIITSSSIDTDTNNTNITALSSPSSTSFDVTNSNKSLTRSRSNTPKQLAATTLGTSLFDAFSAPVATKTTTDHFSTIKSTSSIISGPTDFNDDPFKDYRYEDPFNIKDPFADDDDEFSTDPEKVFKDEISSDDDKHRTNTTNNTTQDSMQTISTSTSNIYSTAKSNSTVSSDFLNQFESFNLNNNPSPVPSHHSSSSSAFTGMGAMDGPINSKSKSNTPIPTATNTTNTTTSNSSNLFDNFADFDAFSTKSSTSTMESNKKTTTLSASSTKINKPDPFLDAFNDNFDTHSNKSYDSNSNPKKSTGKSISSLDAFDDAFSAPETTKSRQSPFDAFGGGSFASSKGAGEQITAASMFDAFNDNNFEDDFFKNSNTAVKETNLNKGKLQNKSPISFNNNDTNIDNFAKFDAFSNDNFNNSTNITNLNNNKQKYSLPLSAATTIQSKTASSLGLSAIPRTENLLKVQNQTLLTAVSNTEKAAAAAAGTTTLNENGAKLPEKFSADYSKPETFDDDLQEAIKRSMVEQ
ncbi:epidermal growth factor receptor substrate 15-like 1 isoform X2 [Musca domestica]|uniref:Epidermal growth factor receptor substrate 15-like 1 isoform X2 n=2 Tax=Musca domestica TaxID=7370 RepID=A0A1I8NID0_MUSDO|nr:epidermal growth factor receptor substrate 15-like 1 isoform X2 [Musca domestica]